MVSRTPYVADNLTGTAYLNCEVRIFNFTPESTSSEAHITEDEDHKKSRVRLVEKDSYILGEMTAVEDTGKLVYL